MATEESACTSPPAKKARSAEQDDTMKPNEKADKQQSESTNNNNAESKDEETSKPKPITEDGEMPQKKFYRSRAHCNPLSHNDTFDYPAHPHDMDWTVQHFPNHPLLQTQKDGSKPKPKIAPDVLDIGCGFGGLTLALSRLLPQNTILGLEIRDKVTEYVRLRIVALRKQHATSSHSYQNCSVLRSNTMKFLPNYFPKASILKMFFCFPDPHFKRKNHPRRIISDRLLAEYAYLLQPGVGRLYCITDVEDLHRWHMDKCTAHPLFVQITKEEELDADPCVEAMKTETEEGKKVERSGAAKYFAVFRRIGKEEEEKLFGLEEEKRVEEFFKDGAFGVVSGGP